MKKTVVMFLLVVVALSCSAVVFAANDITQSNVRIIKQIVLSEDEPAPAPTPDPTPDPTPEPTPEPK